MKKFLFILLILIPVICLSQEFSFTQEWDTIPVEFGGIECQVPWTTGYNYIQPTFCDIDGDDDYDLFFGSDWGRLTFCQNSGDVHVPVFDFVTDSYVLFSYPPPESQEELRPAFCDIDNDDDNDLLLGIFNRMYFFRNIGDSQAAEFVLEEDFFQGINFATDHLPCFIDIDNDDDYDLFIGFGYAYTPLSGQLAFYRNEGTPDSASMILESNQFLGIDLGNRCIPSFCDIDNDDDYDMFLGDDDGVIHYYRNDGNPGVYDFTEVPGAYAEIVLQEVVSPTFCDIDYDGDFDLFVGSRSWGEDELYGDIFFYENTGSPDSASFEHITNNYVAVDIGLISAPAFSDINNDGLLDMFLGDIDGNVNYFTNTGSAQEPRFSFVTDTFQNVFAYYQSRPCFGDLDNDGDLEMLLGRSSWDSDCVMIFINHGTPELGSYNTTPEYYIETGYDWTNPDLVDINNDGDLDLFAGHLDNMLQFYENTGSPEEFRFQLVTEDYLNTGYIANDFCSVAFGDIDQDGDYDIIRGYNYAYVDFYRNNGTPEAANFILEQEHFLGIGEEMAPYLEPFLVDIDDDNDLDLFIGDFTGGVCFWRNNGYNSVNGEPNTMNTSFTLLSNYPNPFNANTVTSFKLQVSSNVNLMVYDVLGRKVTSLFTGYLSAGYHEVVWDASGAGSGVYLIQLSVDSRQSSARKVVLVK